jgi:hypothetical protein
MSVINKVLLCFSKGLNCSTFIAATEPANKIIELTRTIRFEIILTSSFVFIKIFFRDSVFKKV